ncbi:hypothetical protein Syun_004439 [Stephania yunnanensis]|uniref:50S ribosomal protein 6, chloroplastic n=1 Tax=Stephania yunnanensis TaxID=152371 RepID=A0AAP0Q0T4_9MAGN
MSVSALIGSSSSSIVGVGVGVGAGVIKVKQPNPSLQMRRMRSGGGVSNGVIECSSRPQKKATAHHMKTRPRKSAPWDVKRGPTVYPPLPTMPPEWTLVLDLDDAASVVVVPQPPSQQN